jgi:hypothetical protein
VRRDARHLVDTAAVSAETMRWFSGTSVPLPCAWRTIGPLHGVEHQGRALDIGGGGGRERPRVAAAGTRIPDPQRAGAALRSLAWDVHGA